MNVHLGLPDPLRRTQRGHPANIGQKGQRLEKVAAGCFYARECHQPHVLTRAGFGVMARLVSYAPAVPAVSFFQVPCASARQKREALARGKPKQARKVKTSVPIWTMSCFLLSASFPLCACSSAAYCLLASANSSVTCGSDL